MTAKVEALLEFYASFGVEGVKTREEFVSFCREHEHEDGFNDVLNEVRTAQSRLENDVIGQHSRREEVVQSLKHLRRVRLNEQRRFIYRELVRRGFAAAWTAPQRAHFEEACDKLEGWHDFFLSFTSYNEAKPSFNFVNQDHQLLLNLGGLTLQRPEAIDQNLLAQYLHQRLGAGGYTGYYYPHDVDPRTVVQKLVEEAKRSLAFVQLLQRSMFRRYPDNYCQMEFAAASTEPSRVLVFVMSEARDDFLSMPDVPDELQGWYEAAMTHPAIVLKPAETVEEVYATLRTIRTHLIGMVEKAHQRLLEGVPPDPPLQA